MDKNKTAKTAKRFLLSALIMGGLSFSQNIVRPEVPDILTPTRGANAAYNWVTAGANTTLPVVINGTTYYLQIKKTTYANGSLSYSWDNSTHTLTVTPSGAASQGARTGSGTAGSPFVYNGDYVGNSITGTGAGVANGSQITSTINGDFVGNQTTEQNGGGIGNWASAQITSIVGNFIGNKAAAQGGAIYNGFSSTIGTIIGDFIGNSATWGGAVTTTGSSIGSITGDFIGNKATSNGGAIQVDPNSSVNSITGKYVYNSANFGGAIINANSIIRNLNAEFINNSASTSGGAILNIENGQISALNSNFTGNSADKGGAIFNNASTINLYDSNFTGNIATSGAAIYNTGSGTVTVTASTKNTEFTNNNTTGTALGTGYGIYNESGVVNLRALDGYTITVNDDIYSAGTLKINSDGYTGDVVLNGGLALAGGTFDLQNGSIDDLVISGGINNSAATNLRIDVSLGETTGADKLTSDVSNTAALTLKNINFLADDAEGGSLTIADGTVKSKIALANNDHYGKYANVTYDSGTGELTFADRIAWLTPTRGADSGYKWTKTNTGIIPTSVTVNGNPYTFYVDNLKTTYANGTLSYSWNDSTKTLTVTKSGAASQGTRTGSGTAQSPYVYSGDYVGNTSAINNSATVSTITGDFVANTSTGSGGAILNTNSGIGTISGTFTGNTASSLGGAIANTSGGTINTIYADFIGNSGGNGGAIYNDGTIQSITGDFIGNKVAGSGAGICNDYSTIETLNANFIGNSATNGAGIINAGDVGSIGTLTGNFTNNTASSNGGAIYNDKATADISAVFSGNSAQYGGAISNDRSGHLNIEDSTFTGNSATAYGGAIYNVNSSEFTAIDGDFTGNSATTEGGAIYINTGSVGNISGTFTQNTSNHGGAIMSWDGTITSVDADFDRNTVTGAGGALNLIRTNVTSLKGNFTGNTAGSYGGALKNYSGTINIYDSTFTGNIAGTNGAALYNEQSGTINVTAQNDDVLFQNNNQTGLAGGAGTGIYNASGTITFNANNAHTIEINDRIYNAGTMNANVNSGTLKLGELAAGTTFTALNATNSGVIDLQNDNVGDTLTISSLTTDTNGLKFNTDYSAETGVMDKLNITAATAGSKIVLNSIKVLAEGTQTTTQFLTGSLGNVTILTSNPLDNTKIIADTDDYRYTFTLGDTKGWLNVAKSYSDMSLAASIADAESSSYTMTRDFTFISNAGALAGDGRIYTIYGENHTIDGGGFDGITVSDGQTMTVDGVGSFTNFITAITNAGNLTINNSVFEGNATNDINNSGTLTFTGANTLETVTGTGSATVTGGSTTVDSITQDSVTITGGALTASNITTSDNSVSNAGTLTLAGSTDLTTVTGGGSLNLTGGTNTLTNVVQSEVNVNSGALNLTGTLTADDIAINGGVLTLGSTAASSTAENSTLTLNGGTLDIANGTIDDLTFANDIVNSAATDLVIDLSLGETPNADKITADVTDTAIITLKDFNVTGSSATEGEVQIADGTIKGYISLGSEMAGGFADLSYNSATGVLSFADRAAWLVPTLGSESGYKWTKTDNGIIPTAVTINGHDYTFYVDILKTTYANGTIAYTWNNETKQLTATPSGAASQGVRTGSGTEVDRYVYTGDYVGNSGAPISLTSKYIDTVTGDFVGQTSNWDGGAINLNGTDVTSVTGNFIANRAGLGNNNHGGAISLKNSSHIGTITGDFIGNKVGYYGGAIDNVSSTIDTITGDFIGNRTTISSSYGGAIYNSSGRIGSITG
ncbi:MAG: hypothetical protein K6C94_04215, partial [Candidatus Gastranaerophilales bacterium]|nr:hypothetical protein [Candidatus Gastranaerophilales bacterium]